MIQIANLNIVKKLLDKDKVGAANLYGVVRYQRNVRIFVDNLENPNGVIVCGDEFNYIHSKDEEFITKVRDKLLGKGKHLFGGIDKKTALILKQNVQVDWEEHCHLYYMPEKNIIIDCISDKVEPIDIKDIEVINEHYTYKSDNSLQELINNINMGPSAAIYDGNKIVSWVMTHDDGSMGVMYTLKEYRKKGHAIDVTLNLAHKLINRGEIPFIHIINGNNASVELAKKCGFEYHGEIEWFGIIK